MPRIIVFDVNETLLDLAALDPHFEQVFGDGAARKEWFARMLRSAFVATITGTYRDFGTIGRVALEVTAQRRGVALSEEARAQILGGMRMLPPHPEVPASLERLKAAGLRLAALTNSTGEVADAQLTHAGLHPFFEQVLSVDAVRRLKPAREVYLMAAERLGVSPQHLRLVAAHDWDITGAMRAGCAGAFVARPGMVLDPLAERPDIVGPDLRVVAERILEIETMSG
ncbi:MAG: haloacid dehalogenase type II [Rhodothermales bacterium]